MGLFGRNRTRFRDLPERAKASLNNADLLIETIRAVVGELADGVTITLKREPGSSLIGFMTGKEDEFPLVVRVELSEEPEE